MEITRCPKGHFYDADKCTTCPVCANENGTQEFTLGGTPNQPQAAPAPTMAGYSATEPVTGGCGFNAGGISPDGMCTDGFLAPPQAMKTEAFKGGNEKVSTVSKTAPVDDPNGQADTKKKVDDYDPTVPANMGPNQEKNVKHPYNGDIILTPPIPLTAPSTVPHAFNPVTGWLVCIKGPNKGMDFRIHSQNNHIGRAKHMDICIPGDPTISSERAATLIYDYKGKKFLIAAGTGLTLTYLNGEIVTGSAILKAYDVINIGDTDLLFIPLCGEQFDWKNV